MEKLLVGNWKMNLSKEEGLMLSKMLRDFYKETKIFESKISVSIAPPAAILSEVGNIISETGIKLAAQDCSTKENGAYTGEVSAKILKECGCEYVILGHSERRKHQAEPSQLVAEKAELAYKYGLTPIICVGETAKERKQGMVMDVLNQQLLPFLSMQDCTNKKLIFAYEPVWAIGSGRQPTVEQIQEVVAHIDLIIKLKPPINKTDLKILYGGSVTSENCQEISSIPGVGGLLIGGASLVYDEFINIIKTAFEAEKVLT